MCGCWGRSLLGHGGRSWGRRFADWPADLPTSRLAASPTRESRPSISCPSFDIDFATHCHVRRLLDEPVWLNTAGCKPGERGTVPAGIGGLKCLSGRVWPSPLLMWLPALIMTPRIHGNVDAVDRVGGLSAP